MKCTFYESTGNPNCPFHRVVDVSALMGGLFYRNVYSASLKKKPVKRRTKTSRRVYGKQR